MGWRHYNTSSLYLQAVLASFKNIEILRVGEVFAWRRVFGTYFPISIECHIADKPPVLKDVRGLRIVLWDRRLSDSNDKCVEEKIGWWQARGPFAASAPTQVYLDLQDANIAENYFKNWDETVRRYRNRWNRQIESGEVCIKKVVKEVYLQAYEKGLLSKSLKRFFTQKTHNFEKVYGQNLEYLLAFDKDKKVLGGLAYVYDSETYQSVHFTAFVTKEGEKAEAGVGLVDFWVRECIARKIPFATMGIVWSKGQPKSWKGYGNFKLHFRPTQVAFKNVYIKLTFKI